MPPQHPYPQANGRIALEGLWSERAESVNSLQVLGSSLSKPRAAIHRSNTRLLLRRLSPRAAMRRDRVLQSFVRFRQRTLKSSVESGRSETKSTTVTHTKFRKDSILVGVDGGRIRPRRACGSRVLPPNPHVLPRLRLGPWRSAHHDRVAQLPQSTPRFRNRVQRHSLCRDGPASPDRIPVQV